MISIKTQCQRCGEQIIYITHQDLKREGTSFVVPGLDRIHCSSPVCKHIHEPGETLPILSMPSVMTREEYEQRINADTVIFYDDFRLIERYKIGNGNEIALCFLLKTFCLVFMSHTGEIERVRTDATAEYGAREEVRNIARIIGATKIEET